MRRLWILATVAACHTSSPAVPDSAPASDVAVDAQPTRSVYLASGGIQLLVSGQEIGLQMTAANLADDDDAIEIHQEYYGVPWDAFATNTSPPAEWLAEMDRVKATAAGKPVFLSLTMLDGGRDHLAPKTVIQNGTVQAAEWSAQCYDFATAADAATNKQAYLAYVAWMITEFSPRWLASGIEINLFFEHCPAATAGLIEVANASYAAAKAMNPALVVFPTIEIDHLYGYDATSCPDQANRDACFDAAYAQIAPLQRDRFAMSSYPVELAGMAVADLPADWFTRGAARGGERPLISETGADATPIAIDTRDNGCQTLFTATEADANAYLARVLGDATAGDFDLVNWWSDRDLVVDQLMTDCPCTFDSTWCAVLDAFRGPPTTSGPDTQAEGELELKAFGTMGLRAYDGTPKSLLTVWTAARALPLHL